MRWVDILVLLFSASRDDGIFDRTVILAGPLVNFVVARGNNEEGAACSNGLFVTKVCLLIRSSPIGRPSPTVIELPDDGRINNGG